MRNGQPVDDQNPNVSFYAKALLVESDWFDLIDSLQEPINFGAALPRIIEDLKKAGAKSVVIEDDYLDRDVSHEFKAFYATLFRRYRRHARRFHFFNTDVTGAVNQLDVRLRAELLQKAGDKRGYLGFVVLRPVRSAPVARAVLDTLISPPDVYANIEVQAEYEAHLLGAELKVSGVPFTQ